MIGQVGSECEVKGKIQFVHKFYAQYESIQVRASSEISGNISLTNGGAQDLRIRLSMHVNKLKMGKNLVCVKRKKGELGLRFLF